MEIDHASNQKDKEVDKMANSADKPHAIANGNSSDSDVEDAKVKKSPGKPTPNKSDAANKKKHAMHMPSSDDKESSEDEAPVAKKAKSKETAGNKKKAKKETTPRSKPKDEKSPMRSSQRESKKVERLSFAQPTPTKKEFEVEEGKGTKLGDIPRVEDMISKTKAVQLKNLHRALFLRPGALHEIKKHIRQFSGFAFSTDSPQYEKSSTFLKTKCDLPDIKRICLVLDIERGGTKAQIVERIMTFLMKPTSSGKQVHQPKKRSKSSSKAKSSSSSEKKKSKDSKKKEKKPSSDEANDESKSESESESEDEMKPEKDAASGSESEDESPKKSGTKRKASESESEDDEEKPAAKKPAKKSKVESDEESKSESEDSSDEFKPGKASQKKKAAKKPAAAKKAPPPKKSKPAAKPVTKKPPVEDSSSDEDEPLKPTVKQDKKPPTDNELKTFLEKTLEGADLSQFTMKTVLHKVNEEYAGFDMSSRKPFIKSIVKELIL